MIKLITRRLRGQSKLSTEVQKAIDLYYVPMSPPCRAVLMAAKLIGVNLNLKFTDLTKGDAKTPEFLKMNPLHKVPVLDDNGFYLYESRAIITYLFNKYGKDDSLYPKDPQKRAIVDQMLYFDMGTLTESFRDYFVHCVLRENPHDEEKFQKIYEAIALLDIMLQKSDFVAGDTITLADAAIMALVSTVQISDFDLTSYPNVIRWFDKCKKMIPDYEEVNHKGVLDFKKHRWQGLLVKKQKANL